MKPRDVVLSILLVGLVAAVVLESIHLDERSHSRAIFNCELTAHGRAAGSVRADAINQGFLTISTFIESAAAARRAEAREGGATSGLSARAASRYEHDAKVLTSEIRQIAQTNLPDPNCEETAP